MFWISNQPSKPIFHGANIVLTRSAAKKIGNFNFLGTGWGAILFRTQSFSERVSVKGYNAAGVPLFHNLKK